MTPTLADFETAARVRYNGPNRGPGRARAAGTVLDVDPHPDQPDALRVTVLWDDQDDPYPYTVTTDTLHLWTRLPDPRVYATAGTAPSSAADTLTEADAALATAHASRRPAGETPERLDALEALADRLRDLGLSLDALPPATEADRTAAGDGDALDAWRTVAAWYAADAAAVVWDAWQRETHASRGTPDPVRYDVAALPLMAAEHALAVARHALTPDDGELVPADETAALLRARATERDRRLS
jgi:hypothetical protein